MTSWLNDAGLVWKRTANAASAEWVIAEVERDLWEKRDMCSRWDRTKFASKRRMKRAPFALGPR